MGRELSDYVAQLEGRLDAVVRARAQADLHGKVSLWALFSDELLRYGASEGGKLKLSGPDVRLQPRAGQVVALAVHELAVNAIEHGALGVDGGRVEVTWSMAPDGPGASLVLAWTEFEVRPGSGTAHQEFGTEVLTRMLPYELMAGTDVGFGPNGLRCTVRLPLPGQVGRVAPGG